MGGRFSILACAAMLWVGAGLPGAALAHASVWADHAAVVMDGGANRDRVIDAVQKRYNAKVVRVTETSVNGRAALELRLLSDQRVWTVVVDAETGQVLSGG